MQKRLASTDAVLFLVPALIWGSTWYAITFQLGTVPPLYSISYRFILAAVILIAFCLVRGTSLKFSFAQHRRIFLQAMLLFGFNYWCTYEAEQIIASGLVAIIFSLVIFMNVLFGRLILGNPVRKSVLIGACLGLLGTFLIFLPELQHVDAQSGTIKGILICALGVVFASLGNIASASNQHQKLPVIPTNGLGMLYGGITMFLIAFFTGNPVQFDTSAPYVISLIYLGLFGSMIAFTAYLTLIGRIGPDRAAYALVVVPVVAITISVIFEGYQLTWLSALGVFFLVIGNVFALRKEAPRPEKKTLVR